MENFHQFFHQFHKLRTTNDSSKIKRKQEFDDLTLIDTSISPKLKRKRISKEAIDTSKNSKRHFAATKNSNSSKTNSKIFQYFKPKPKIYIPQCDNNVEEIQLTTDKISPISNKQATTKDSIKSSKSFSISNYSSTQVDLTISYSREYSPLNSRDGVEDVILVCKANERANDLLVVKEVGRSGITFLREEEEFKHLPLVRYRVVGEMGDREIIVERQRREGEEEENRFDEVGCLWEEMLTEVPSLSSPLLILLQPPPSPLRRRSSPQPTLDLHEVTISPSPPLKSCGYDESWNVSRSLLLPSFHPHLSLSFCSSSLSNHHHLTPPPSHLLVLSSSSLPPGFCSSHPNLQISKRLSPPPPFSSSSSEIESCETSLSPPLKLFWRRAMEVFIPYNN